MLLFLYQPVLHVLGGALALEIELILDLILIMDIAFEVFFILLIYCNSFFKLIVTLNKILCLLHAFKLAHFCHASSTPRS